MARDQETEKARQFARNACTAKCNEIVRETQLKITEMRSQLHRRGALMSGALFAEQAKIEAEQIEAMTLAKLDATLEGYELHGIEVDDQMALDLCDNTVQSMKQMVFNAKAPAWPGGNTPAQLEAQYPRLIEGRVGLSAASIKTRIDRRRLMAKKEQSNTSSVNIYHVRGNNNRWITNSQDHSVNVITESSDHIFATMRHQIESLLPDGDEKNDVLGKLVALQKSENSPSFKQRYTEFISSAANHMALIAPFIPALTEMLHKVI